MSDAVLRPSALRTLGAFALADFRDRVRRRSFLAVLAAAGFLGLQAIQGKVEVALGNFTGAPTSAWAGAVMSLVGVTFLALAGFWVVKGSIARDEETGVGQILAATPIASWTYTLGKAASHFLVLAAMAGVLVLSAVVLQLVAPQSEGIDLVAIAAPIVLIALPGFAVVAAFAVLFETLRFLARGFGNLVWFFFWSLLLVAAMEGPALDLFGIATMRDALGAEVKKVDPAWDGSFRIGAGGLEDRATERFRWERLPITGELVAQRAQVVAVALALALVAAVPFDRFDPARRRIGRRRRAAPKPPEGEAENELESARRASAASVPAALAPLAPERVHALGPLVAAELRIALRAMPRWWLLGAAVCTVGGFLAPNEARTGWLAAAFLWPALVWSGLATRDRATGVAPLLAAAESPRARQLPALLVAGWLAGLVCAGGAALGFAAHGEPLRAVMVAVGAAAAPLLAVALGILSAGARLFEGLYVALWYIGPFQRTPPVDFAGATAESAATFVPFAYLAIGAALPAWALAVEARRRATGEARFVR